MDDTNKNGGIFCKINMLESMLTINCKSRKVIMQRLFSIFLISIFLIIGITACGSATSNSGSSTSTQIKLGTLPNGSDIYLSNNNLPVTNSDPAKTIISLVGGTSNESFSINFSSQILRTVKLASGVASRNDTTESYGISVSPDPCYLGTSGSGLANSCTLNISAATSTLPGTYIITPTAISTNGTSTTLSPITILVSGAVLPDTKEITSFSLNGTTGVITGSNISVTMPYGTNVSSLIATYLTTGSSVTVGGVTQNNGVTANSFSNQVVYTVIAADGSTKNYTVTVTVAPNTAKAITAFSLDGTDGVISGTNIAVTMPYATNVAALISTFTTTGESIMVGLTPQISEITPNNFTNPVTYTVYAANGSSQNYTVTVTVAPAKWAYFPNSGAGSLGAYTLCSVSAIDGSLTNCSTQDPVGGGLTAPHGMAIKNNYAYFAGFSDNSYTKCRIDASNGMLSNCSSVIPAAPGALNGPYGLAINGNYAYFPNSGDNTYTQCLISASDGSLSECNSSLLSGLNSPLALAFNNGYAYFTNFSYPAGSYTQCNMSSSDGSLSGCNTVTPAAPGDLSMPFAIAFNNGYAYFANFSSYYTQCSVSSSDGTLSGCNGVVPLAPGALNNPVGVAFNGDYAYFTNLTGNSYTQCSVNPSDGSLSGCNTVIPSGVGALSSPYGIAFH